MTYHDSCYYGRHNNIYESPREVIAKIMGKSPQEMERNRQTSMCCGGGGGWMWMDEPPDQRVNILRAEQALETKPDVVAVSCPFCMTMLTDGVKAKEAEERVQVLDVMELVDRASD